MINLGCIFIYGKADGTCFVIGEYVALMIYTVLKVTEGHSRGNSSAIKEVRKTWCIKISSYQDIGEVTIIWKSRARFGEQLGLLLDGDVGARFS